MGFLERRDFANDKPRVMDVIRVSKKFGDLPFGKSKRGDFVNTIVPELVEVASGSSFLRAICRFRHGSGGLGSVIKLVKTHFFALIDNKEFEMLLGKGKKREIGQPTTSEHDNSLANTNAKTQFVADPKKLRDGPRGLLV